MMAELRPIRKRADELSQDIAYVMEVMVEGARRCKVIAHDTMDEVREAIGLLLPGASL
jgi:tryptophanyl-tRNA synthetase